MVFNMTVYISKQEVRSMERFVFLVISGLVDISLNDYIVMILTPIAAWKGSNAHSPSLSSEKTQTAFS